MLDAVGIVGKAICTVGGVVAMSDLPIDCTYLLYLHTD